MIPKPVPVDPETILILGLVGALVGAVTTIGGYLLKKNAEAIGKEIDILPTPPTGSS